MIRFNCTKCGKRLKAPTDYVGREVKCSRCEFYQTVPAKGKTVRLLGFAVAGGLLVAGAVFLAILIFSPKEIDGKLKDLKSGERHKTRHALEWFARADPQDDYRARVTAAVEPLLADGGVHQDLDPDLLLTVYLTWASKDNVPTMIRWVEHPPHSWDPRKTGRVMEALGKMQEEQAAAALARKLDHEALHESAVSALEAMGPVAEKAVVAELFDRNPKAHKEARKLLRRYGTKEKVIAAEAVRRLTSNEEAVRVRALDAVCGDAKLLEALKDFPDPAAADALASLLLDSKMRDQAAKVLLSLGRSAHKAVLQYVNHPNEEAHREARRLCRELKIPQGRLLDQAIEDLGEGRSSRRRAALEYLAKLKPNDEDRAKVAPALNAPLRDANRGVAEEALRATQVWGMEANTKTLLKLLGNFDKEGKGRSARIIEVLGAIRDPRAAEALAEGLTHVQERANVGAALKAIGPAAEDAVIPYLRSDESGTRVEACRVLAEIGTRKSLRALERVRDYKDGSHREVEIAMRKIEARR